MRSAWGGLGAWSQGLSALITCLGIPVKQKKPIHNPHYSLFISNYSLNFAPSMTTPLETRLAALLSQALKEVFGLDVAADQILLQPTRKEFRGDQTLVVFPYTKQTGKSPEETGRMLGEWVERQGEMVAHFNVVKGFLNLELNRSLWLEAFSNIFPNPTQSEAEKKQRIMVEFSSPNTNKPLHLGHMRTNFLGSAMAGIFKAAGHTVIKTNLVNDRGIHICKSMVAYKRFGRLSDGSMETPESTGMKGDKLVGKYYVEFDREHKREAAELRAGGMSEDDADKNTSIMKEAQAELRLWEQGDVETRALWSTMNGWVYEGFEQTYRTMGVTFDKLYYESQTYLLGKDIIDEGLEKGVFYKIEDGSVWIDLTDKNLDKKLLLRGDGTSVYMTQDLGTADLKYADYQVERSIYVVGNEQDYHFQVLFEILRRLGRPYAPGLYHLSYGMVDLPSGKMKSREGTVVDADELMDEMMTTSRERTEELGKFEAMEPAERERLYEMIGVGAIKYFLLRVDPKKRMLFNPIESIDLQGNTATAIQYVHARISSVLRKAAEAGYPIDPNLPATEPDLETDERELLVALVGYGEAILKAAQDMAPSHIAHYCYEVSRLYNKFFATCSILQAPTGARRSFRLALCRVTGQVLKHAMGLLGIEVPERM